MSIVTAIRATPLRPFDDLNLGQHFRMPEDALKIVMRGADKEDKAAA